MAIKNMQSVKAVAESNHIAAVKTGQIYSQYGLAGAVTELENGMLVVVDHVGKQIKKPAAITDVCHLHLSVIKEYEGKGGKYFSVKQGEFAPSVYKLHLGDIFETNAVLYDDAVYANPTAIGAAINATTVYGIPDVSGNIKVVATLGGTEKTALKAVELVSLPNGETGIKWVCILNG